MIVKFGADFVPIAFLTASAVEGADSVEETGEVTVTTSKDTEEETISEETTQAKEPLLSKPAFIGGFSVGILIAGGVLGFLLAKMKIKKVIDLYEDI